eukprot:12924116-Prorocentrum_lima.AAC.1
MTSTAVVHAVVALVAAAKLSTTYLAERPGNDKKLLLAATRLSFGARDRQQCRQPLDNKAPAATFGWTLRPGNIGARGGS